MKPTSPPHENWNDRWATWLMESLYAQGVRLCCISPGSRSTPLTAAAARHPGLETRIFWDERNAAFFALGYGRATGHVAPLICTSGTAAANYYPAIIEASVDRVPMLVLSADRPPELQHTGANQTIDQLRLFGTYPRWFQQLPCPSPTIPARYLHTTMAEAVAKATIGEPGPVHLNFPFRKPLGPEANAPTPQSETAFTKLAFPETVQTLLADHLAALGERLAEAERGVLLIGRLPHQPDDTLDGLSSLIDALGWPTFVDPGAALAPQILGTSCIAHYDLLLQHRAFAAAMEPDCVLHLGGPLLSKALLQFVAAAREQAPEYIHISPWGQRIDPDHMVTRRIQASIGPMARDLAAWHHKQEQPPHHETPWRQRWLRADKKLQGQLEEAFAATTPRETLFEPALAREIAAQVPEGHALIVGNSMPIRHMTAFGQGRGSALRPYMNRGASGIDGLISTAMGVVEGSQQPGVLYLGDLSLIHNLNGLVWLQEQQLPLIIVVANNHGGGIFGHLPIAQCDDIFRSHFHTPHSASLARMAAAIGIESHTVESLPAFRDALAAALGRKGPTLIEALTDSQRDLAWLHHLTQGLQEQTL